MIPFVENSLAAYFQSYVTNGGGCHEGTGDWNYGMNYSMRYVLSWENATVKSDGAAYQGNRPVPVLPSIYRNITFGDNDGSHPVAFYFLMAQRLHRRHAALRAAAYLPERLNPREKRRDQFAANGDLLYAAAAIPTVAEMRKLKVAHQRKKVPVARVYRGHENGRRWPTTKHPAIASGSSRRLRQDVAGHGMLDLLGFDPG